MTFREEVSKELVTLSKEEQIAFAWRCAVRALPFLGNEGHFDFWKKKERQKHLYSVFLVIDITYAYNTYAYSASNAYAHAASNAAAIVDAANAADAAADANASYSAVSYSAANAAYGAADTSYAYAYVGADFAYAAANKSIDFKTILLQDLKNRKENQKPTISIATYGEIWPKFQQALKGAGCGYWANVYQDLFENNFEFDLEKLDKRINVPQEIKDQGAAAVAEFLEKIESEGAIRLNEARIIILGDKGAGKTCVARKLVDSDAAMTTPEESTAGVDTSIWSLKKDEINIRIWDFAGHTVTHAVHQFFLSERCLYIMVYDGRTEERNRLEYWLDYMKNYGGNSKAIILINERDRHSVKIPENYLKEKYPIAGFFSFNVGKDKKELVKFRTFVADYIKNNPSWKNQEIPTSYYLVKEELEKQFNKGGVEKGEEHIVKNAYLRIAKKHKVKDPEKLLQDLHFLGVSLWYEDMDEYDTLILNPEWISQGVYQIINWVSNEKKYALTLEEFLIVFREDKDRYPKDKHKFLFNLIKHYELAFDVRGTLLIIPHLLNEDQPATLPVFETETSLMMRYEADQPLPPNTISRFIVRHNEQIKKEDGKLLFWKHGVILEDDHGSLALVREIDRTISVSVKGNDKTNYLSKIRETLNAIFDTFVSQHPELKYKVADDKLNPQQNLWVVEKEIITHVIERRPFYDYKSRQDISMLPAADNYNIPYLYRTDINLSKNLSGTETTSPANDAKQYQIDKLSAELKEKEEQIEKIKEKERVKKEKEFIRKKVKRWRFKSSMLFLICFIFFIAGILYFPYRAGWDMTKAKENFIAWQDNFLVFGILFLVAIIFAYSIKMFYECWFSHSQIENFKKGIEIPEDLK